MDLELLYDNARRIIIYQQKELMLMAVKICELEKKLQKAENRAQASEEKLKIERAVRGVLGPAVVTQVQCQGPDFAFEAPGPGGSQH